MTLEFLDAIEFKNELDPLFKALEQEWFDVLKQQQEISPELLRRKEKLGSTVTGIIGLDKQSPSCFALLEKTSPYYGNLMVYSIHPEYRIPLANACHEQLLNKIAVELLQYTDSFDYRDEWLRLGLLEKERQRMSIDCSKERKKNSASRSHSNRSTRTSLR